MVTTEMLAKLGETLGTTANVKSVFGEPIETQGRTVVPVAKIAYGFGAGGGSGPGWRRGESEHHPEGGGGGGGIRAFPAGALEITPTGTRFIPFHNIRWMAGAFAAGVILGHLFSTRRGKNQRTLH
jgi:uncharacterized spore protein YtfJ